MPLKHNKNTMSTKKKQEEKIVKKSLTNYGESYMISVSTNEQQRRMYNEYARE